MLAFIFENLLIISEKMKLYTKSMTSSFCVLKDIIINNKIILNYKCFYYKLKFKYFLRVMIGYGFEVNRGIRFHLLDKRLVTLCFYICVIYCIY